MFTKNLFFSVCTYLSSHLSYPETAIRMFEPVFKMNKYRMRNLNNQCTGRKITRELQRHEDYVTC